MIAHCLHCGRQMTPTATGYGPVCARRLGMTGDHATTADTATLPMFAEDVMRLMDDTRSDGETTPRAIDADPRDTAALDREYHGRDTRTLAEFLAAHGVVLAREVAA